MTAVRRIYVYLVTFAALSTFALGIANLIRALLEAFLNTASATTPGYLQDQVALWAAAALVGLPLWAVHWTWAQRLSLESAERSSILRRLFLYAVLSGATIAACIALNEVLTGALMALVGSPVVLMRASVPPLPILAMALAVWIYHWRAMVHDRLQVGELGAASTLRRWYTYAFAFLGLVLLLGGAQLVLMSTWLRITSAQAGFALGVAGAADALVGLAVWAFHWVWLPRTLDARARDQEEQSSLRTVYLFLALALTLVGMLAGLSQALYYGLARLLGIQAPGGVAGSLIDAAAGPVSVALVYGAGWLYQRHVVSEAARIVEEPRQIGVRRVYTYLTSLVALCVLAVGLAGMLWTLGDLLSQAPGAVSAGWWRDRLSVFATMTIVGLPVWLLHCGAGQPTHARSLARRIYLYVALIGAMLGLLISGAAAVYRLLSLVLGSAVLSMAITELTHALAIAVVAAGAAAYHWHAIRMDARSAPAMAQPPAQVVVELSAPNRQLIDEALETLRSQGVSVHRHAA